MHGKGPCDGIGATVKSTATRSITTSGTMIGAAEEFYEFTIKFNKNSPKSLTNNELPIYTFYVSSTTVERIYEEILKPRWEKLTKTGKNKCK